MHWHWWVRTKTVIFVPSGLVCGWRNDNVRCMILWLASGRHEDFLAITVTDWGKNPKPRLTWKMILRLVCVCVCVEGVCVCLIVCEECIYLQTLTRLNQYIPLDSVNLVKVSSCHKRSKTSRRFGGWCHRPGCQLGSLAGRMLLMVTLAMTIAVMEVMHKVLYFSCHTWRQLVTTGEVSKVFHVVFRRQLPDWLWSFDWKS